MNDDNWHHVALMFPAIGTDVTDAVLYVDGSPEPLTSSTPQAVNTGESEDFKIGSPNFNGIIDEVRLYSTDLSSNDLAALFLNGTMRFNTSAFTVPPVVEVLAVNPILGGKATVTGELMSYDLTKPSVKIYWGDEDAGPNATDTDTGDDSKWDHVIDVASGAALELGEFNATIDGPMTPGTHYYFRAYASSSDGSDWSSGDPSVKSNLAAYWRFDEESGNQALDSTWNKRNGLLEDFNGSASRTAGFVDKALLFDGTDDWVNLNQDDFFLKDSFDGRSLTFRFKAPSQYYVGPTVTRYQDLVGYWPLNEGSGTTAADLSPAKTEGEVVGSASWGSDKFGGGLILDGTNDAVSISPSLFNEVQKSDYSISVWMKPDTVVDNSTKNAFLARGYNSRPNNNYYSDINTLLNRTHDGQKVWTSEDLHLDGDAQFMNAGVGITQNNQYMFLALSTFVVPEDGNYGFRCLRKDDYATIWLDLDKNNQFDLTDRLGGPNNFTKDPVTLTAGDKHLIAIAHGEGGGHSRIEPWIKTPSVGWTKINPADPAQDGFWVLDAASPWGSIITPTSLHKTIFQRNGEGLSLAPGNILNMTHLTVTGTVTAVASTSATQGDWRHVVGVVSTTEEKIRIYVDGSKSGELDIPFGSSALDIEPIHYWRAGGGGGGTIFNDYLAGETDDIRIYDVALTDGDVASIYNSGLGDMNGPAAAVVSQMIYDEGDSTNGLGIKFDNGILSAKIQAGGNQLEQTHVIGLADDQWHHVAVTFGDSPKAFKLYVDGYLSGNSQLFASEALPAHDEDPALGKIIGSAVYSGLGNFKGLLDEVRIYDRGLTAEEVDQVHSGDMLNTGVVSMHAIELPQIVTTPATNVFPKTATINANVLSTGGVITIIDEIRDLTFNAGTAPGIVGWYSASDMDGDGEEDLGFTYGNGAVVASWNDASGFMRDMTSTSGNPTYSMFGLNEKPVVNFDGDDKIWTNANYDFLTSTGYTVFLHCSLHWGRQRTSNSFAQSELVIRFPWKQCCSLASGRLGAHWNNRRHAVASECWYY